MERAETITAKGVFHSDLGGDTSVETREESLSAQKESSHFFGLNQMLIIRKLVNCEGK